MTGPSLVTVRQYNEAKAKWKKLDRERERLEAKEDFDADERLVEINDEQFALMNLMDAYRAQQKAQRAG